MLCLVRQRHGNINRNRIGSRCGNKLERPVVPFASIHCEARVIHPHRGVGHLRFSSSRARYTFKRKVELYPRCACPRNGQ